MIQNSHAQEIASLIASLKRKIENREGQVAQYNGLHNYMYY